MDLNRPTMESLDEVSIHLSLEDHKVQIGALLRPNMRQSLIDFLKLNHDCFAWSHTDMTGIDPEVMVHRLQVDLEHPSFRKKRRKFAPEHNHIINEEIQKMIDIGSVREVQYPNWLAMSSLCKKRMGSGEFASTSPT